MDSFGGDGRMLAGRYRLVSRLGRGGMGTVWRAVDELLEREVAVKELHPDDGLSGLDAQLRRERTLREARTLAQLKHPNVIVLHDVVEEPAGQPWIVMELVDGQSLADQLAASGPVGPREAARIGLALLDALRVAHASGVLHRDIKPANVLMEAGTRRVVLTDFGIAQVPGATTITETGSFVGSPEYTAPERMSGHRTGPESDLWSLGVLLCALVSGESPFHRDSLGGVLHAVVFDEIRPPTAAGPLLPVVRGLLERDWGRRLDGDAAERLLRACGEGGDTPEMPVDASQVVPRGEPVRPPGAGTEGPGGRQPGGHGPVGPAGPAPVAEGGAATSPTPPGPVGPSAAAPAPAAGAAGPLGHTAAPTPVPASASASASVPSGHAAAPAPRIATPGPGPDSARDARRRRPASHARTAVLTAVAVVGLLAAGAGVATLLLRNDDSGGGSQAHRSGGKVTQGPTTPPSQGKSTGPAKKSALPDQGGKGALPKGYTMVNDPAGFRLAVPDGWGRSYEAPRVYYYSPGKEFRIGVHIQPQDPKGPLGLSKEADAKGPRNYRGYRSGQVIETEHEGIPAALWAFVWDGGMDDGGARQTWDMSWDEGNVMCDLWVSAPVSQKGQGKQYFDTLVETFDRPGGPS